MDVDDDVGSIVGDSAFIFPGQTVERAPFLKGSGASVFSGPGAERPAPEVGPRRGEDPRPRGEDPKDGGVGLAERFGLRDGWPVVCEPFTQWVLEDHFAAGRPEFERVGVQVVDDVVPYEFMKLRLLNATHQALGYLGYLAGHRYVHEVAQDPTFASFLRGYMDDEATPTLRPVPGIDLDAYKDTLLERFANPGVADTLMRINYGSSDRISIFLLPVVREQLAAGGPVERAATVVAGWCRYAEGAEEQGREITQQDRLAEEMTALARAERDTPGSFLAHRGVVGDLGSDERFAGAFRSALESLWSRGAAATVADLA